MPDHLVHRVVASDVLADDEQLAACGKHPGGMQAAGGFEGSLRLPQFPGGVEEHGIGDFQAMCDRRKVGEDRLQRRLAAQPAGRAGEKVAREPPEIDFHTVFEKYEHPVLLWSRLDFPQFGHFGNDPLGHQKSRRQFLVVARRAHDDRHGMSVQADFQGLLHGHLVTRRDLSTRAAMNE